MNDTAPRHVRNLTPPRQQRERCFTCHDEGQIVAGTRIDTHNGRSAEADEYGPCPYCELGYKIEYQADSPWGSDGFWQGREQPARAAFVSHPPMTQAEQLAAIQTLAASVTFRSMSDLEPAKLPDDVLRRALMSDEEWFAQEAERAAKAKADADKGAA